MISRSTSRIRLVGTLALAGALGSGLAACSDDDASPAEKTGAATTQPEAAAQQTGAQVAFLKATSPKSYEETVKGMDKAVASTGAMVLAQSDQGKALAPTGLKLKATSFFVGTPAVGKVLFTAEPAAGVTAPYPVYVWKANDGKVNIGFHDLKAMYTAVDPKLADAGQKADDEARTIVRNLGGSTLTPGAAVPLRFVSKPSPKSFEETTAGVKKAVEGSGAAVLGESDQGKAMASVGMKLKAKSFFVGNAKAAKALFGADPAIGAAAPFRLYVWHAPKTGQAMVGYLDPAATFAAVNPQLAGPGKQTAEVAGKILEALTR